MIREATYDDVQGIVELGVIFIKSSPIFKHMNIDIKKMCQYAMRFIREDNKCYFVDDRDGEIVAFLSGYIDTTIFGNDIIASEQLMFIHPDKASTARTGIRLMRRFEEWAESKNADMLWFIPTSHGVDDRWGAFCKTLGYEQVGTAFNKRL